MRPPVRITSSLRISGRPSIRCFAISTALSRNQFRYHELQDHLRGDTSFFGPLSKPDISLSQTHYRKRNQIFISAFSTAARLKAISFRDLKSDDKPKNTPGSTSKRAREETSRAPSTEEEDPAERVYREAQKESEALRQKARRKREKEKQEEDSGKESSGKNEEEQKRNEPPPPPPHGNKSPWQVFSETLSSEFKASKEWNESTKQLASSAHQFTENESVKRARAAYTAASGAATSRTASAIRGTGTVIGQGAAWAWDTTAVKGVRTGVNATASGIDKVTKPVRDTKIYKTAVGGVKDVIDDGSSSKYGGWVDKEERRKQRELRELNEAGANGRPGRRPEKMEEDPNAGTNVTLHKDSAFRESWKNFRDSNRLVQSIFSLKSTYNESENPLISTARSVTDKIAGFFAENETAMVIKKFREMDPAFQVEPFLQEMREYILPEVLDAYVKGDTETLKIWLSAAQYSVYAALTQQYITAGLKSDGRILDIRHVDILSARMLENDIPVFIITCRTQEVHVYRNAKTNDLAAGMEDKVQLVTYAIGVTRLAEDILLVPTTECLLLGTDRETNTSYTDLAASDDFLASHVLRISETPAPGSSSVRDSKGKAKQFNTVNGKTVVVKESFVYSNKGFRNLNQAQLLIDQIFYPDNLEAQQWLIYYISRPLIGSYEPVKITPATISNDVKNVKSLEGSSKESSSGKADSGSSADKKDIKTFNWLLNSFPLIARQMQPGLEKVFNDFREAMSNQPQTQSKFSFRSRRSSISSSKSNGSILSGYSNGHLSAPSSASTFLSQGEDYMRTTLENAVTAAIDLFQQVDKQQLSFLGATTELTGPAVERLIERYVAEQLHESILFPAVRSSTSTEDRELESRIHGMQYIDVAQIGVLLEDGRKGKDQLIARLEQGVDEFRMLAVAGSPQEMLEILLKTHKAVASRPESLHKGQAIDSSQQNLEESEKMASVMMMNADTLVSLLLVVMIRSPVKFLWARLAYMRYFIFIDDVESGEIGYALSTFEAVLSYLASDSVGLRKASRKNRKLWQAVKEGDLEEIKSMLEATSNDRRSLNTHDPLDQAALNEETGGGYMYKVQSHPAITPSLETVTDDDFTSEGSTLAHVFPFQADTAPRKSKRVSMDMRSLSGSSEISFISRTTTLDSINSAVEGDISIETLAQTQDIDGNSILMMAIQAHQPEVLDYLLSLEEYFPPRVVMEDSNKEGTTLLSAAVQLGHAETIETLLASIFHMREKAKIAAYLAKVDHWGRTVAHYMFNAPQLIPRYWDLLPWRRKDRNGQTPLLALCRSYDHPHYARMVNDALQFATYDQNDDRPLHLDDHVDAKGNTLLHAVNDPALAVRILTHCDSDANATNDKQFTPLMVASKYGRMDMVRALFGDKRVDALIKESRGMTAVELAKDDEIRNRIDDMVLVSNIPAADGRVTAVVRSFFVEDASIRFIIKSAVRNDNGTISVTTCRRSLADFENLAKWLSMEHPASWLASIFDFRSPFQIPPRPSRATLMDVQVRLDRFLKIMLAHSTYSTHELLWEFILFPEIQPDMMAERSRKKAELRNENIRDEYEPVEDVREVSTFAEHARDSIRGIDHSTKSVIRRVNGIRTGLSNFRIAIDLCAQTFSTLAFLPHAHVTALSRFAASAQVLPSDPYEFFHQDVQAILTTVLAILSSLVRPHTLISSIQTIQKSLDRHFLSLRRSDRWPLGLLDETRKTIHAEAMQRAEKSREELTTVSCELRYTQQTIAGELAGWQELHVKMGRRAVRGLAERMVVREKARLEGMKRAIRGLDLEGTKNQEEERRDA